MSRLLAAIFLASLAGAAAESDCPDCKKPNIVKLAESVKDLSILVAAVVAGDLADTLSSPGPFTVFAPTNEAFAALPAGTLAKLMKPENKKELVDILTYHVLREDCRRQASACAGVVWQSARRAKLGIQGPQECN